MYSHETIVKKGLTNFDIAAGIQQDVVTLDVTVNNALGMEMLQATACLQTVSHHKTFDRLLRLTSWQIVEICSSEMEGLLSITSVRAPPSMYSMTTQSSELLFRRNASRKLTMFLWLLSFMTMISLTINSFLG